MFCIAAFIVLAVLGIFSASYRELAKKAWYCVTRKLTFRPCDIRFDEEIKGKILGKLIVRAPRLARFFQRFSDWLALAFVALSVWSLAYVLVAGLNLFVYDTCNPKAVESCSLGGEACGISQSSLGFTQALRDGRIFVWAADPFVTFAQTLSRIPDRLRTWNPLDYTDDKSTFSLPLDRRKPTALEIVDPGCRFCSKLMGNIKEADFETTYNLTYIAYPIPDPARPGQYKFANSYLISRYLEALKIVPSLNPGPTPPDWQLLETILLDRDSDGVAWQIKFNTLLSADEAEHKLQEFIAGMGYDPATILAVAKAAASPEVASRIQEHRRIVEQKIHTVKIPTIMFDGRRYDRVVAVDQLQR